LHNEKENPLYKNINYLLDLANKYDFCISFGDGLRPGCLADASDWFQLQELLTIGRLIDKCRRSDVQAIVEGPGHLPLNHIETNVVMAKAICKGAPFYVLGPIVTDIGAGYDHIVGAIGGALAGLAGADFLCYLTPSEHLGLPSTEDVREGVIAMKIAAHSVDIVKYGEKASRLDLKMAEARAKLDWKMQYDLSIDPEKAKEIRERVRLETKACSMCGKYCVFEILSKTPRKCI
jgi:phosphomethylpyrimidine synthase